MAPEEEEEALSTLRIMPSAESIVSAAEQIGIYSPSRTQLQVIVIKKYSYLLFVLLLLFLN